VNEPTPVSDLAGKRIVVVGGARGIGAGIATAAARLGAAVSIFDLLGDRAARTAALLREEGLEAGGEVLDVTDPDQVQAALAGFDELDGLVYAAGISGRKPLDEITADHVDRVLAVNLRGAVLCCQATAPALAARGGAVVGICSSSAHQGVATHSIYAASKGGMLAMFRALAVELAPDVRVNTVSPGVVPTDLNAARLADPEQVRMSEAKIPLRRLGGVGDVADAVCFLLSDAADWITGTDLAVDGGETAI
jgi:NAD(P)-dependent dehydrogenase (short-subunit alcohol dehydrogenase family)